MTRPRTYAAITKHSLEVLPRMIAKQRAKRALSLREASRQIGINKDTLRRLEEGEAAATPVLVKVFGWLDGKEQADAPLRADPAEVARILRHHEETGKWAEES